MFVWQLHSISCLLTMSILFCATYCTLSRLCGDVCLQPSGEVNIVIAKPFQNKHIGRRVVNEIIQLAREKNMHELQAEIYIFNTQSQKMFQSVGFKKIDNERYILTL